jgi:hypothetical protein
MRVPPQFTTFGGAEVHDRLIFPTTFALTNSLRGHFGLLNQL